MVDAGNKVIFQKGNRYIEDRSGRVRMPLEERSGAFVFDLWKPRRGDNHEAILHTGRFQALMEDEGNENEGFVRQTGPSR